MPLRFVWKHGEGETYTLAVKTRAAGDTPRGGDEPGQRSSRGR